MEKFKSKEENPDGLHTKYIISRADGTPINPENVYFVLKLKGDGDPVHLDACRHAVLKYAERIQEYKPELAEDIYNLYYELINPPEAPDKNR